MRISISFHLLMLCFPVFFVLHRVNEHYGVVAVNDILALLLIYSAGALVTGFVCLFLLKDHRKAFIIANLLLFIFFLFGAVKDFLKKFEVIEIVGKYSVLLPLLAFIVFITARYLKISPRPFRRLFGYVSVLLLVLATFECLTLISNIIRDPAKDFGDKNHSLINNLSVADSAVKPAIYWIILDEYAAGSTLKKVWKYENPLDSQLRSKGFFVADSAVSGYPYTHFSLASILDMQYLQGLPKSGIVDYKDMMYATRTLYENNVVEFLEKNGYTVYNGSVFDMKGHAAPAHTRLNISQAQLVSYTTLSESIRRDIAWNFDPRIVSNPEGIRKLTHDTMKLLYDKHRFAIDDSRRIIAHSAAQPQTSLYILHYMMTHEPWVFNENGSFNDSAEFYNDNHYLATTRYMNKVVNELSDDILRINRNRDFVIIIQSDHGFRFEGNDPELEKESCRIFYSVYCSDGKYPQWTHRTGAVNSFRILFNKYFHASYPMLPAETHLLKYRRLK